MAWISKTNDSSSWNLLFLNLVLKTKFFGGSVVFIALLIKKNIHKKCKSARETIFLSRLCQMTVFQPAISTSSLYFGASGLVLYLSSSNFLGILMSTHGLHAAILGKNAFQFGTLGPNHLANFPLACACCRARYNG